MRALGLDLYYNSGSGMLPSYGTDYVTLQPVSTSPYTIGGQQFSFGGVLKDLGDYIVTTAGEVLKTAIDIFGRRVVEKTGEVLAPTPIGQATTAANLQNFVTGTSPVVWIGGAVVLALLLSKKRR